MVKVFISVDMEGITGASHWNEVEKGHEDYRLLSAQMHRELRALCEGLNEAGVSEIWLKDAHDSARNIDPEQLPMNVVCSKGFSGHPYMMLDGLDSSFHGIVMLGYHAPAGDDGSPLAHTLDPEIRELLINKNRASEFLINAYTAALNKVPVLMVTGDDGVCAQAHRWNSSIQTVEVNHGRGNMVNSIHPRLALERIRASAQLAVAGSQAQAHVVLPKEFEVEITYAKHYRAYKASFYPGVERISEHTICYRSTQYFDVLRMLLFLA